MHIWNVWFISFRWAIRCTITVKSSMNRPIQWWYAGIYAHQQVIFMNFKQINTHLSWLNIHFIATFILWKEQSIAIMRPELQSDFEINSSAESNTKSMAAMMLYVVLPFVMCEVTMGVLIKTLYSAMPTMELNAWQIKFAVIIFYPLILSTILYTIISIMHMHIVLFTRVSIKSTNLNLES